VRAGVVWLGIPLAVLIALITCVLFTQQTKDLADYQRCVWWHGVAAVLEMLTEPLYILTIREMSFGVRLCVEGLAHLVRCVLTYVLIVHANLGLMAFAFAQIAFSAVLIVGYFGRAGVAIRRGQSTLWYSSLLCPFMQAPPDLKLAYLVLGFKVRMRARSKANTHMHAHIHAPRGTRTRTTARSLACARARTQTLTHARTQACSHTHTHTRLRVRARKHIENTHARARTRSRAHTRRSRRPSSLCSRRARRSCSCSSCRSTRTRSASSRS
jgi:hypothetical protein